MTLAPAKPHSSPPPGAARADTTSRVPTASARTPFHPVGPRLAVTAVPGRLFGDRAGRPEAAPYDIGHDKSCPYAVGTYPDSPRRATACRGRRPGVTFRRQGGASFSVGRTRQVVSLRTFPPQGGRQNREADSLSKHKKPDGRRDSVIRSYSFSPLPPGISS